MKSGKKISIITALLLGFSIITAGCGNGDTQSSKVSSEAHSSVTVSSETESKTEESKVKENSAESTPDTSSKEESSQASAEESSQTSESSGKSSSESKITPIVWEVTDTNGNNIYMMGSIHAGDADALIMPDYFETAYARCDALAVECDATSSLSTLTSISDLQKLVYSDGTTIKDHVPEDEYNSAVNLLTDAGSYSPLYDMYKPIMWSTLAEKAAVEYAGLSFNYAVDTTLINRSKKEGKELLEIESVESQMALLTSVPDETQYILFNQIAQENYLNEASNSINRIYVKWKTGALSDEDFNNDLSKLSPKEQTLIEDYNKMMEYDRNENMAQKAMEYLESGKKVMFVVGSAHFFKEKGIIQLMKNNGCTVRQLTHDDADPSVLTSSSEPADNSSEVSSESTVNETDPAVPRAA